MWNHRILSRIDWRIIPLMMALMFISLLIISATDPTYVFYTPGEGVEPSFFTPKVLQQLQHFIVGWGVFFSFCWVRL